MERTYSISNLSENQLQVIQDALEIYFRIQINQYTDIAELVYGKLNKEKWFEFKEELWRLRREYYFPSNLDGRATIACDIHQVIRHKLSWDRHPEGGITVNFDEPLKMGTEELPKVERENE